jgi:L-malate glycosyltransferase
LRRVTLRVLHVDTERGWRGGERQALWLAAELARCGHESIIAARAGEPLAVRASELGLPVIDCSPANELDAFAAFRLRRSIKQHQVGVIHAHTAHAVAVAALASVGTGVPLVVSRRVDFPLRDNVGTRVKYARASIFIAVSRAVAAVLERSGIDPRRVRVVPDGVDVHRVVAPASAETLSSLGVVPGRPLVVQVAQLVGHKDPLNFVRAIAYARQQVPRVQALLIGDGPLREPVMAEIATLGLEHVVHAPGYRTDADALLAAASVACLSSREEGMGSVLLDALAFGIPIAATRAGGIPEIVEHERTGLLAPVADSNALGESIARLLVDRALASRIGAVAHTRAEEFSVERLGERTLEVYREVAGSAM